MDETSEPTIDELKAELAVWKKRSETAEKVLRSIIQEDDFSGEFSAEDIVSLLLWMTDSVGIIVTTIGKDGIKLIGGAPDSSAELFNPKDQSTKEIGELIEELQSVLSKEIESKYIQTAGVRTSASGEVTNLMEKEVDPSKLS